MRPTSHRAQRCPRAPFSGRLPVFLGLVVAALLGLSSYVQADEEPAPGKDAPAPAAAAPEQADWLAQAKKIESDLIDVLETVSASSVTVIHHARLPASFGGGVTSPLLVSGAGSGVLVDYRGLHVVTNAHVVKDAQNVVIITRDGTRHAVKTIAKDTTRDLAVLSLPKGVTGFKGVPLGDIKATDLREGAWVLATGNPFMLAHDGRGAASLGVFSGVRGAAGVTRRTGSQRLLQHDAEINPGNSGGPLWGRRGELLGINGAIVTRSQAKTGGPSYTGTSISVPVAQVRRFLDRVLRDPASTRTVTAPAAPRSTTAKRPRTIRRTGFLGLRLITSRDASGRTDGALVIGISKKSALRRLSRGTGLQSGDRITHVSAQGKRILVRTRAEFEQALKAAKADARVSIHYIRHGQIRTWSGDLGTASSGGQ